MTVYIVTEHTPKSPVEGFDNRACCVCSTLEKAIKLASQYNEEMAPYFFTVDRCEVEE